MACVVAGYCRSLLDNKGVVGRVGCAEVSANIFPG